MFIPQKTFRQNPGLLPRQLSARSDTPFYYVLGSFPFCL